MAPWLLTADGSRGVFSINSTAPRRLGLNRRRSASRTSATAACSAISGLPLRRANATAKGQYACSRVTFRSNAVLSNRTGAEWRTVLAGRDVEVSGRGRGFPLGLRAVVTSTGATAGVGAPTGRAGAPAPQAAATSSTHE